MPAMGLTKLQIARALKSSDPAAVTATLQEIAAAGEAVAAELGYVDFVAQMLDKQEAEVVAAAALALGAMGSIGTPYASAIGALLRHPSAEVRAASCKALGAFGDSADDYSDSLRALVADDPEAFVKTAAIPVLAARGFHSATCEVIQKALDNTPAVAETALEALAALGKLSEETLRKQLQGSHLLYALRALAVLKQQAFVSCLDEVVSRGLANEDAACRAPAVEIIGNLAEAAVLPNIMDKIQAECLKSSVIGVRVAAALAFASMGTVCKGLDSLLMDLFLDSGEDAGALTAVVGGTARRPPAPERKPKCAALYALGRMKGGSPEVLDKIRDCFNDTDWEVRLCAVEAATCLGRKAQSLIPAVAELLSDVAYPVRAKVLLCLGSSRDITYCADIVEALKDTAPSVREAAATALSTIGEEASDYAPQVYRLFNDKSSAVRATAIRCIASMCAMALNYAPVIGQMMNEEDTAVRIAAIEALSGMGADGAAFAEDIAEHIYFGAPAERNSAQLALAKLGIRTPAVYGGAPMLEPESAPAPSLSYAAILAAERAKMGL
jgi:HEAT repeat protein